MNHDIDTLIITTDSTKVTLFGVTVVGLPEWAVYAGLLLVGIGAIAILNGILRLK